MSARVRLGALLVLLLCGGALVIALYHAKLQPPLATTLTNSLQVLGAPVKLVDRAASRMLPVGDVDERSLGDIYRQQYDAQVDSSDADQRYCDELLPELTPFTTKPFPYRAYVVDGQAPNAMALPGGVILVTRGLFGTLHSEAEVVSVLAHELGHIERGHCFDAVRLELLARKAGAGQLGELADLVTQLMMRHAYSKSLEHEADDYAFMLMTGSRWDPRGSAAAFRSFKVYLDRAGESSAPQANPLRDYFQSHPPVEIRADEYGQRADAWWRSRPTERRYVGRLNLAGRIARTRHEWGEEWVRSNRRGTHIGVGTTTGGRSVRERRLETRRAGAAPTPSSPGTGPQHVVPA